MIRTEIVLKASGDIPVILTRVERKRVKKVKLRINPTTIPSGRDLPISFPPMLDESTIGSTGKMQGESIVTIPARNANAVSKSILFDIY